MDLFEENRIKTVIDVIETHTPDYIEQKWKDTQYKIWKRKRILQIKYAASGICAVFALFLIGSWFFKKSESQQWREYVAIKNEYFYLPDSTEVWLTRNSKLKYADDYGSKNRQVSLSGIALFDVIHNKDLPFIVDADTIQIKVLGTKFLVSNSNELNHYSATLIRGSVEVFVENRSDSFLLEPNEQFIYSPGNSEPSINSIDSKMWEVVTKDEALIIRNKPIREIMTLLSVRYQVEIYCNDEEAKQKRISLKIKDQNIDEVIDAICNLLNLNYTTENHIITIHP